MEIKPPFLPTLTQDKDWKMLHFGLRAALSYFKWKRELLSHFILSKIVSAENCY